MTFQMVGIDCTVWLDTEGSGTIRDSMRFYCRRIDVLHNTDAAELGPQSTYTEARDAIGEISTWLRKPLELERSKLFVLSKGYVP